MMWMAASPLRPVSGVVSTEEGGRCPCGATLTSSPSDAGTMGGSAPLAWSGIVTAIGTFKEDMGLLLQCRLRRLLNSASSKDDPKSSASGHGSSHLHAAACVAVVAPRTVWRGVPAPAPAPPRTRACPPPPATLSALPHPSRHPHTHNNNNNPCSCVRAQESDAGGSMGTGGGGTWRRGARCALRGARRPCPFAPSCAAPVRVAIRRVPRGAGIKTHTHTQKNAEQTVPWYSIRSAFSL